MIGAAAGDRGLRRWAPAWRTRPRGYALLGAVWPGGAAEAAPGAAIVGPTGRLERLLSGRADAVRAQLPRELAVLGGPGAWIGPALIDAHVHLSVAPGATHRDPLAAIGPGLGAVRDLGAPADAAARLQRASRGAGLRRRGPGPHVAVAGPMLTATGGYPSTTWGAGLGVSSPVVSPAQARLVVRSLAARGVDLIKVALEPGSTDLPTPSRAIVRSIVDAAHEAGLPVVAHALRARMVVRALDCGVDELAHTPTERLDDALIERLVGAGVGVVSTLQTFFSEGEGADAAANAAALVRAGGTLRYGTDLGNTGTVSGVDPRELDRLAHAGLGRLGALRAATEGAAGAVGMNAGRGRLIEGEPASLVLLDGDPLVEPTLWRVPLATVIGADLRRPASAPGARPHPPAPAATDPDPGAGAASAARAPAVDPAPARRFSARRRRRA